MFTGIIEELGVVNKISHRDRATLIEIAAEKTTEGTKIGDSISVNGCCLTAVEVKKGGFSFEAIPETLKVSNLGALKINDKVNLERSLKVGERVSGHFVLGHVDCLGIIRRKYTKESNLCFEIAIPQSFFKYCVSKGSIAIDGISLTIAAIHSNILSVYIIPHTLKNTTLNFKGPSAKVNLEFDLLLKGHP
jgi:riboflavin synthase